MTEILWVLLGLAVVFALAYFVRRRGKRSSGTGPGPGRRSDQDFR